MFKSLLNFFGFKKQAVSNNESSQSDIDKKISLSIAAFMNRPIYKELTEDIIDKTPDDELLQTVFDNLMEKFPKDYQKEYETVARFSKGQQAIYMIWCLEAEVNNGGFNQYYYNSRGQYAKLIPEALRLVNANEFADLLTKTNNIFETDYEKIIKYQDGTLEGFSKSYDDNPLNDLFDEFYELNKNEELQKLQIEFIRKNKNEFIDK